MTDMIAGAQIVHECAAPPDHPVRWRVVFPRHHCAVSGSTYLATVGGISGVIRSDVRSQTAYAARQEWARRLGLDPEQCEVEMVKP